MRNIAKLSVTNFIDKCANVLLGVAGSTSLGLLCGHAYRKVVPSEKGFDATATALFGGSLYIIDTVGKKFFDPIFKNFGSSTKRVVSGMRLALEAGLAYKLTEIVAKQLEAPFEMTPYDTQFFGTCAAVGIAGMVGYAKVSEKTLEKGLFVTAVDTIVDSSLVNLSKLSGATHCVNRKNLSEIEALVRYPEEHCHIGIEGGNLKVKEGNAKKIFGSIPSSQREYEAKFLLITDLYSSFLKLLEPKEDFEIKETDLENLNEIKRRFLAQVKLVLHKAEGKWELLIKKLNERATEVEKEIENRFQNLTIVLKLKQDLERLGLKKEQLLPLLNSLWGFSEGRVIFAELEDDISKFTREIISKKEDAKFIGKLLEECKKNRKEWQWGMAIKPPSDPEISIALNDAGILLKRLEKYFPPKPTADIPKFPGTQQDFEKLCIKLMNCWNIILTGLTEDLKTEDNPLVRIQNLIEEPDDSAGEHTSPYFGRAFLYLRYIYRTIVNLGKDLKNQPINPDNPNNGLLENWEKFLKNAHTKMNDESNLMIWTPELLIQSIIG